MRSFGTILHCFSFDILSCRVEWFTHHFFAIVKIEHIAADQVYCYEFLPDIEHIYTYVREKVKSC